MREQLLVFGRNDLKKVLKRKFAMSSPGSVIHESHLAKESRRVLWGYNPESGQEPHSNSPRRLTSELTEIRYCISVAYFRNK